MLAFVHIPKTAGTTVSWILRSSFGMRHCDAQPWHAMRTPIPFSPDDLERLRRFYPWLRSLAGHRVTPYAGLEVCCPDIQYFTLLRDPLKTSASFFQFLIQTQGENPVFEEWVQTEWPRNRQTKMISGTEDVAAAIQIIREKDLFVGLVERFDESMLFLRAFVANDLNISYRRMNVNRGNALARDLVASERTRQMLVEMNQADLQLHDYVAHDVFPSYHREYGARLEEDLAHYRQSLGRFNRLNIFLSLAYRTLVYRPALGLCRWRLDGCKDG